MSRSAITFRKIVAATELGAGDSVTLQYAKALARVHNATLIILHVIDPVTYAFPDGLPPALSKIQTAQEELHRLEEEVRKEGIQTHSHVESGVICDRILECVRDQHADLLLLGTRARSAVGHLAVGTVVRQLIGRCPCPILTVPPESAPAIFALRGGWSSVLAATDFSPSGITALETAHQFAHCQFTVLHVWHAGSAEMSHAHLERLRMLAPLNESHTVPVEHIAIGGEAADIIPEWARSLHVDLLVLGAPAEPLDDKSLASSTILQIISRVSCPVLCVPVRKHATREEVELQVVTV